MNAAQKAELSHCVTEAIATRDRIQSEQDRGAPVAVPDLTKVVVRAKRPQTAGVLVAVGLLRCHPGWDSCSHVFVTSEGFEAANR